MKFGPASKVKKIHTQGPPENNTKKIHTQGPPENNTKKIHRHGVLGHKALQAKPEGQIH